jgi:hypothetical protein
MKLCFAYFDCSGWQTLVPIRVCDYSVGDKVFEHSVVDDFQFYSRYMQPFAELLQVVVSSFSFGHIKYPFSSEYPVVPPKDHLFVSTHSMNLVHHSSCVSVCGTVIYPSIFISLAASVLLMLLLFYFKVVPKSPYLMVGADFIVVLRACC